MRAIRVPTAAAAVKTFLRSYAHDIMNPRYVRQHLFRNMQQQLCTSRVGHRIIASSIHILSQLLQLDRLRELHRVHFFGDGQVISRVLQKIALANKHEHTPTPHHRHTLPQLQHLFAPACLAYIVRSLRISAA